MKIVENTVILGKKFLGAESSENPVRTIPLSHINQFLCASGIDSFLEESSSLYNKSKKMHQSGSMSDSEFADELEYIAICINKLKESLKPYRA